MKVIGAGFGRTGTLSLKTALERLGYGPCYHMTELMRNPSHAEFWSRAVEASERRESVSWEDLLCGYEATVDWPGCVFYRELASAYPEAKVILSERDPVSWYESARKTIGRGWEEPERNDTRAFRLFRRLVPGADRQIRAVEAVMHRRTFGKNSITEEISREEATNAFIRHNEEVRRLVPEDRLLIYDVREGWAPLCAFLGVEEPDEPFPRANDRENFGKMMSGNLAVGLVRAIAPSVLLVGAALAVFVLAARLLSRKEKPRG